MVWEGKPRNSQEMKQMFPAVREAETGRGRQLLSPLEASPAGSHWAFLSSKSCTHTNCVSNIKRTGYYDLKEPTVCNLSRFRQDKRGKGMLTQTEAVLGFKTEKQNKADFQIGN